MRQTRITKVAPAHRCGVAAHIRLVCRYQSSANLLFRKRERKLQQTDLVLKKSNGFIGTQAQLSVDPGA